MDDPQQEAPVKLYYRIGEVAAIVGVEPHVLRYWETEFRSIRPQKSRKGQRIYSRRDVERLLRVKDLLYNQGFTIAGARKRLREQSVQAAPEVDVRTPSADAAPFRPEQLSAPEAAPSSWVDNAPRVAPPSATSRSAALRWRQTLLDARRELTALLAELDRPQA